jgi:hypothetical protein
MRIPLYPISWSWLTFNKCDFAYCNKSERNSKESLIVLLDSGIRTLTYYVAFYLRVTALHRNKFLYNKTK